MTKLSCALTALLVAGSLLPQAHAKPARVILAQEDLAKIVETGDSDQYAALTSADHQLIQAKILPHLSKAARKQYWLKVLLGESKIAFHDVADVAPYLSVSCGSLGNGLIVRTNPPGPGLAASEELPTDDLENCKPLAAAADGSACFRSSATKVSTAQVEGDFLRALTSFDKKDYRTAAIEWGAYSKDCGALFPGSIGYLGQSIRNFHVIDKGVALRGARPKDDGIDALAAAGVKTVIDLQGGDLENTAVAAYVRLSEPGELPQAIEEEGARATAHGMVFVSLPLNSMRDADAKERAELLRALAIMSDPKSQPVYIHCEHGADRTGLLAALFRVAHDKWTPKAAHDEMIADGHSGFIDHLVTGAMDKTFKEMVPLISGPNAAAARAELYRSLASSAALDRAVAAAPTPCAN